MSQRNLDAACKNMAVQNISARRGLRLAFAFAVFATLAAAVLLRTPKWLSDFDQSFYITIAYDMVRHGVFSNGTFDSVDSTRHVPPPGRFFGPVYPALVAGMMKLDARFARAVACNIEVNAKARAESEPPCDVYALPIHLVHAALLAVGVAAIALSAELIIGAPGAFWIAGSLATLALLPDADLFSFIMTESITFCLFAVASLALVWSWRSERLSSFLLTGVLFGILTLTRAAYSMLLLLLPLIGIGVGWYRGRFRDSSIRTAVFVLGSLLLVGPWALRNQLALGSWGITEEYGSAALVERFAFNQMTFKEFGLAFPYCLPAIGPPLVQSLFGRKVMDRFVYHTSESFFHAGRLRRDKLVESHGRLDPILGQLVQEEYRSHGLRHFLVSIPLAWCGMWVGGLLGFLIVPMFGVALLVVRDQAQRSLILYSTPALAMLALHALVANHYTRYNLILIGPFVTGAALIIHRVISASRSAIISK